MKRSAAKKIKTMVDDTVILHVYDDVDIHAYNIINGHFLKKRNNTSSDFFTVDGHVKEIVEINISLRQQIDDVVHEGNHNNGEYFYTKEFSIEQLSDAYKITKTI